MKKINKSVSQCINPTCTKKPVVEIDAYVSLRRYTAGQALSCSDHIEDAKKALSEQFPEADSLREVRNPGWLRKEQNAANSSKEIRVNVSDTNLENKSIKNSDAPASEEEIQALRNKFGRERRK